MQIDSHPASTVWNYHPEPSVWWGAEGIDTLIRVDGPPYAESAGDESTPVVPEVER